MRRTAITLIIVLALIGAATLALRPDLTTAWANGTPLKIFFNDKPSNVKALEVDGVPYVPVYFPAEERESRWEITIARDQASNTVRITKTRTGPVLRGDHNCERCGGSGKCQSCYPVGSGKNIQDESCPVCNGSGNCGMCNGSGKY
jgi:hypothetical protein